MTLYEGLTLAVTAIAAVSAVFVSLAQMDEEKRSWLRRTTWRVVSTFFYLFMIIFASLAMWGFAAKAGLPTRGEILTLLLWIFNGAMGIVFWVYDAVERKRLRIETSARTGPSV